MIDVIAAKTHTSDYLLHKYWARKPHNVLNTLIASLLNNKSVVLDPFCGSGVFIREASKLGHKCYGYDVNPIASILAEVTCNPPSLNDFCETIEPILIAFKKICDELYVTTENHCVRYYVHESVVACPNCGQKQTRNGSKKICLKCGKTFSFGLRNLIHTNITNIITDEEMSKDKKEIKAAKFLENKYSVKISPYDLKFPRNDRILAFEKMTTKKLFTERNFYLLSYLADRFHEIENREIKETCLLLLTASSAQCSRLVAYRNNLSTGGPAWSVPGFWVPSLHLESNPYKHIIARYKKFCKGLQSLTKQKTSKVHIYNKDCCFLIKDIKEKVDLVFLDPPYGDSVPYMEFSMLWNSFLRMKIDINNDISVSDRNQQKQESWEKYKSSLIERIKIFKNSLSETGKFLITFNNHDHRAWEALIEALQKSNMNCISTMYQIPAVISSKAQFSIDGSYISDIYSIYKYDKNKKPVKNLKEVRTDLIKTGISRGGKLPKSTLLRAAFVSVLNNNISSSILKNLDPLINDLYQIDKNYYQLKPEYFDLFKVEGLSDICVSELKLILDQKIFSWEELYARIAARTRSTGIPDPSEIFIKIEHIAKIDKGIIIPNILGRKSDTTQKIFEF